MLSLLRLNVGQPQICCGKLIRFALPSIGDLEHSVLQVANNQMYYILKKGGIFSVLILFVQKPEVMQRNLLSVCVTSLLARVHCLTT